MGIFGNKSYLSETSVNVNYLKFDFFLPFSAPDNLFQKNRLPPCYCKEYVCQPKRE